MIKYLKIEENYLIYNNNRNNRILGNKFNEGNERYVQWKLHEFAEIKKDTNKWKDDSCFWMGRNSIIKVSTVPKVIYRSNTLPIRIPKSFCTDTKRIILKFVFQWFAMTYLAVIYSRFYLLLAELHVCLVTQSCLNLCDPVECSPTDSSIPGDSPGKKVGTGCYALLQGLFPTAGLNSGLLHCRWTLY